MLPGPVKVDQRVPIPGTTTATTPVPALPGSSSHRPRHGADRRTAFKGLPIDVAHVIGSREWNRLALNIATGAAPFSNGSYRGTTVIGQRIPGARLSLASAVISAQFSDSASATLPASYAVRFCRNSHTRSRNG